MVPPQCSLLKVDGTERLTHEYRFKVSDEILREFGYTGPSVTYKPDTAIAALGQQAYDAAVVGAGNAARAAYIGYANGSTPIPNVAATEDAYQGYLENNLCVGAHCGHPDYEHYSYKVARERFHSFFILYLSGKADHLPPRAREFFDNFNWQRIRAANRIQTFARLLARIYRIEQSPAGNRINPGPGINLGGAERDVVIGMYLEDTQKDSVELVIVQPNIEHNMLSIIMVCTPCLLASSCFKSHEDVSRRGVVALRSLGPPSGDRQSSAATMILCTVRFTDLC